VSSAFLDMLWKYRWLLEHSLVLAIGMSINMKA
jgi:hypothetical protein